LKGSLFDESLYLFMAFLSFAQIRLERLVDKWSGSIEVGVTTHNPNTLDFPATMTNMRSGECILMWCWCRWCCLRCFAWL